MRDAETMSSAQAARTDAELPLRLTADEAGRLGDEIYERDVRPEIEEADHGRMVAIDVDSGMSAVADSELDAAHRLRLRRPGATNVWLMRIGYRAVASIGGGSLRGTG